MNKTQLLEHFLSKKENVIIIMFVSGFDYIIKDCMIATRNTQENFTYSIDLYIAYLFFLDTYKLEEADISFEWFDDELSKIMTENNTYEELEKYYDSLMHDCDETSPIINVFNHKFDLSKDYKSLWNFDILNEYPCDGLKLQRLFNKYYHKYWYNFYKPMNYFYKKRFKDNCNLDKVVHKFKKCLYNLPFKFVKKLKIKDPFKKYYAIAEYLYNYYITMIYLLYPINRVEFSNYIKATRARISRSWLLVAITWGRFF